MPGGRPTKYKPEYARQAAKMCELGATDDELADFFEVTRKTLCNWKSKHKEFLRALTLGKEASDARVVSSLYHRAMGYSHDEERIVTQDGKPEIVTVTRHYPPDTTAAIFWLKNRDPEKWREKQEISGDMNLGFTVVASEDVKKL